MSDMNFIDSLNDFGLTRQEGSIYSALLNHGEMTGYEVAKDTGISRSNVYAGLTALVEKGAAYLVQGEATKYRPVEISRFTENRISELKKTALWLEKHAPRKVISCDGYITIIGAKNIKNKIRQMLAETELRLYMMAPAKVLGEFENELAEIVKAGKKVVLLTKDFKLAGAKIYETKPGQGQLRFITDSSYVLTGELTGDEHDTCLYSGQKNLVEVMKEALKDKITLLGGK
ncbi:MAG: TrmB family transcriptional regulator [Spirochaetia bacterium]|nr:TrmB family transcriptional regulator [Spirochaetia bacterium]MDY5817199.1 helix-turn-helix domain-containing protein [Treponema sp.]